MASFSLTATDDVIAGTAEDDQLAGTGGGNDRLEGRGGNDLFVLGSGDWQGAIDGGTGLDTVRILDGARFGTDLGLVGVERLELETSLDMTVAQLASFKQIAATQPVTIRIHGGGTLDLSRVAIGTDVSLILGDLSSAIDLTAPDSGLQVLNYRRPQLSAFNDTLRGSAAADFCEAGGGNDLLYGNAATTR